MVIKKVFDPVLRNKTKTSPLKVFEPIKDFSFSANFIYFVVSFSVKLSSTNPWNSLTFLCNNGQNVADSQSGHTNSALASKEEERKWCIVLLKR